MLVLPDTSPFGVIMGPIFVLFPLLMLLVGSLMMGAFGLYLRFGKHDDDPEGRKTAGKMLLVCSTLTGGFPLIIICGSVLSDLGWLSTARGTFENAYGFAPPPQIQELHGLEKGFGDYCERFLKFKCDQSMVDRLSSRFSRLPKENGTSSFIPNGEDAPAWWDPPSGDSVSVYSCDKFKPNYGSDRAYMIYNAKTGWCYFHWIGID